VVGPSGWFALYGRSGVKTGAVDMVERTLPGGVLALVPGTMEDAGFTVAFTERSGGASSGIYTSLNLGLQSGDDPELVWLNRDRVAASVGVDGLAFAGQVHGARIERVAAGDAGSGLREHRGAFANADGLVTDHAGVALAILTADCVPVALADPETGRLAVVHAGWRGIAGGIVGQAIAAFDRSSHVVAAVGPAIGPEHYEVGEDVARAVGKACPAGAVTRRTGTRLLLDLPSSVAGILAAAGVGRISRTELCTACEEDRFFSHRRDGTTGRQALVAVRKA
jgi:polyphenol oxidase